MWHKVRELQLKGLNKTQIGIYLGVNRKTVRRYLNMTMEEFVKKQSSHRKYRLKLENYEQYVRANLEEYPYISAARIHDWLKECYPDFPVYVTEPYPVSWKGYAKNTASGKRLKRISETTRSSLILPTGNTHRRILGRNVCALKTGSPSKCTSLLLSCPVHDINLSILAGGPLTPGLRFMPMNLPSNTSEAGRKRSFTTRIKYL